MRFLPTKVHGLLDYLTGTFLLMAPWLLRFHEVGAARWLSLIMGAVAILYSFATYYEWGGMRSLSMKAHLTIDLVFGIFLVVAPWLFGFAHEVFWPFLIVGLIAIVASLITKTEPSRSRTTLDPSL